MRSLVGAAVVAVACLLLPASAYATVTVSFVSPTATVTMDASGDSTTIADASKAGNIAISNVPGGPPGGCTADPTPNTVDCPASAVRVNAGATNPANLSVALSGLTRASATVSLGSGTAETLTATGALTKAFSYFSGLGSAGDNTVDLAGVTGGLPGGVNITTLGSNNHVKLPTTQGNLSVDMGAGPSNALDFSSDTADTSPVTFTYTSARALQTSATATFRGVDTLIGTGGTLDDTFVAGLAGNGATLDGGAGTNTLDLSAAGGAVDVNLVHGTVTGAQRLTIANFQNVTAPNANGNTIVAGLGDEVLNGGSGTNNTVSFAAFTTPVTVDLANGTENSTGGQHDTLINFQFATGQRPAMSSASSTTFTTGQAGSFTVTSTGAPTPSLSESGTLPTGVSFIDNGDGTATLAGTPAAGTGGSYTISIKASNGISPDATQVFTLNVNAPTLTVSTPTLTVSTPTLTVSAPTLTVNPPSPDLSRLRMRPRAFQAATKGKAITAKLENGTTITYRDSLAAYTTFRVYRELPGINYGRRCVARSRGKHRGKGKLCNRLVLVGSFTHHDKLGTNRLRFTGRLRGSALSPGSYKLEATAKLAGRHSRTVSTSFAILVPPPACQDRDRDGDCDAPGQI